MNHKIFLCETFELQEKESKGFNLPNYRKEPAIFVVRNDNQFYAYENSCPHTSAPLNWQPNQFMDMDNDYIQCSVHGALFQIQDGLCIRGPCVQQSLTEVKLIIEDSNVYLITK